MNTDNRNVNVAARVRTNGINRICNILDILLSSSLVLLNKPLVHETLPLALPSEDWSELTLLPVIDRKKGRTSQTEA